MAIKNNILMFLVLVLALPFVNGIYAGVENNITDFGGCMNLYQVSVLGIAINESNYFFNRCQYQDRQIWNCPCDKNENAVVLIPTESEIGKTVDVVLQYRLSEAEFDFRTKRFNSLLIERKKVKAKPFWDTLSEDKTNIVGVAVFSVLIILMALVGIGGGYLGKMFTEKRNEADLKKEEDKLREKFGKP